MKQTEKMTRAKFEGYLCARWPEIVLGYRKFREGNTLCHLYYVNGRHVGTWTARRSFVCEDQWGTLCST